MLQYTQEMILRLLRSLIEIGDAMRVLCCLLLGWLVLLSGCGDSQEAAVAPLRSQVMEMSLPENEEQRATKM
jgi:hypothetical protein